MPRLILSALAGLVLLAAPAQAQTYPSRAVHIVVPSAAGGGTDIVSDAVRDFVPVTQVAALPNVLVVHPSVPAKSVAELIALAQAKPDQIAYASAGVGTSPHMGMELFKSMAGVNLRHIPYRGTAPAVNDLIGGQVSAMMANVLTAKPQIDGGQLRALGVSGSKRSAGLPNIPTIAEAGVPGYSALQWYGLLAPAGTPNDIVVKLQAAVAKALELADVKERLAADGAEGCRLDAGRVCGADQGRARQVGQGRQSGEHRAAVAFSLRFSSPSPLRGGVDARETRGRVGVKFQRTIFSPHPARFATAQRATLPARGRVKQGAATIEP